MLLVPQWRRGRACGIYNDVDSTLAVTQSTFSGTALPQGGGGISNRGSLSVTQSTFSGDTAGGGGGGIDNGGASATVDGTMVADGCAGTITERQGYNLDSGASCGFSRSTDLTSTTPLLGSLQNNGGPTQTLALLPGSPAIDSGGTRGQGYPAADQRGYARPDAGETHCDIGAFELGATPALYDAEARRWGLPVVNMVQMAVGRRRATHPGMRQVRSPESVTTSAIRHLCVAMQAVS